MKNHSEKILGCSISIINNTYHLSRYIAKISLSFQRSQIVTLNNSKTSKKANYNAQTYF